MPSLPDTQFLVLAVLAEGRAHGYEIHRKVHDRGFKFWTRLERSTIYKALDGLQSAGPQPELGDVNLLDYPSVLAEVSQALEPYMIEEPRELPGRFGELEMTKDWLRRFSFPKRWT